MNGRISLTTARTASAHVVNGSIFASLDAVEGTGEFKTVNGTVDLEIPEAASATIHAGLVFGLITTDFALHVHRGFVASRMDGDLNGGGPKLFLETVNGSIHLRKARD